MTPEQIQVGKFYLRSDYPNSRYIGAGKRKPWTFGETMEFTEKHIICIKSKMYYGLGLIFKTPEDEEGACVEDWDVFYLDPCQDA